jgi:hypothetical protein
LNAFVRHSLDKVMRLIRFSLDVQQSRPTAYIDQRHCLIVVADDIALEAFHANAIGVKVAFFRRSLKSLANGLAYFQFDRSRLDLDAVLVQLYRTLACDRRFNVSSQLDRRTIANYGTVLFGGELGEEGLLKPNMARVLGVQPGASDILAIGESSRLRGTASCEGLKIETSFGEHEIEFDKVAALVGRKWSGSSHG